MVFKVPEQYRLKQYSTPEYGNNGVFLFPLQDGTLAYAIASEGLDWEHVSVSLVGKKRCPKWHEMCQVKDLFWSDHDCVVQFHPPKANYVNNYDYCLHLWRPISKDLPNPPKETV